MEGSSQSPLCREAFFLWTADVIFLQSEAALFRHIWSFFGGIFFAPKCSQCEPPDWNFLLISRVRETHTSRNNRGPVGSLGIMQQCWRGCRGTLMMPRGTSFSPDGLYKFPTGCGEHFAIKFSEKWNFVYHQID